MLVVLIIVDKDRDNDRDNDPFDNDCDNDCDNDLNPEPCFPYALNLRNLRNLRTKHRAGPLSPDLPRVASFSGLNLRSSAWVFVFPRKD